MARTTLSVTVGTVLTSGDIAPLIKSMADPVANMTTANNATSAVLIGLTSSALAGLTTTQLTGLISVQMGGLTSGQVASLAATTAISGDITLIYDTSVVTNQRILAKALDAVRRSALGRGDIPE